jgi:hypothetical protein
VLKYTSLQFHQHFIADAIESFRDFGVLAPAKNSNGDFAFIFSTL